MVRCIALFISLVSGGGGSSGSLLGQISYATDEAKLRNLGIFCKTFNFAFIGLSKV